jgi:AAA ATPase domain
MRATTAGTLAARMSERDEAAFVGRARELRLVDALLAGAADACVLLIHGAAGVGKSALLREIARRGLRAGWSVAADARDAWSHERPLLLVDDHRSSGGRRLRAELATVPARTIVAVATRRAPERSWFADGWETVTLRLPLGPLSPVEARALLAAQGLRGDPRVPAIVEHADGSPQALRTAADAARFEPGSGSRGRLEPDVVRDALRCLHVPAELARSPLARGYGLAQRAASVRTLIREAAEHAFGDSHDERLLRRVLVRGYLDPAPSHELAAAELHVSRATYFRRLKVASERVTAYVTAAAAPAGPPQRTGERGELRAATGS